MHGAQDVNVKMDAQAAERLKQAEENEALRIKLGSFLEQFESFNGVVGRAAGPRVMPCHAICGPFNTGPCLPASMHVAMQDVRSECVLRHSSARARLPLGCTTLL